MDLYYLGESRYIDYIDGYEIRSGDHIDIRRDTILILFKRDHTWKHFYSLKDNKYFYTQYSIELLDKL